MTVSTETSGVSYTGNGSTTLFATGFRFVRNVDVVVATTTVDVRVVLTEGIHYSVTGAGLDAGGTVTFVTAPANDVGIEIYRDVPFTQTTNYRTQGSFAPAVHEESFDYSVFRDQELARRITALEAQGEAGDIVAGNGLAFAGSTLNVGAADAGLIINANDIALNYFVTAATVDASTASAGVDESVSRGDHRHQVSTAAPPSSSIVIDGAAAVGVANSLSRSDHIHTVTSADPVSVTKAANAEGVSTAFARADHKHDITTATAVDVLTSASTEGVATTLARSDHHHFHGRLGTTTTASAPMHALAIPGNFPGFLRSRMATKLENTLWQGAATTVGTTPGTLANSDPVPSTGEPWESFTWNDTTTTSSAITGNIAFTVTFHGEVVAHSSTDHASFGLAVTFRKATGGVATGITLTSLWSHATAGASGWAALVGVNGTSSTSLSIFDVLVAGSSGATVTWCGTFRRALSVDS